VVVPPVDHDGALKDLVEDLDNRLAKLEHENAQLKKAVLGSRSEKSKMPRIKTGAPATAEERQKTRRERAAAKAQAPTVRVEHKVPDAERRCAACDNEKLDPVWTRLLDVVRVRPVVGADETRLRLVRDKSGKTKNGFVWTFGAHDDEGELDVAYVFTEDRSGSTPKTLLEGTTGVLLVDGYSGYNVVDEVSTRRRAACHAHLRRYFHEALPTAPAAQGLIGASKLDFRKERAGPIRERMRAWLDAQRERHPPKSPIAGAIRHADNQWGELGVFLDDPRVPLDNNGSERALRRVALGRKNYLFVHDVDRGASIAGLYSLVATCEARAINPFEYLADVIARVQDHPARSIDKLLPGAWAAARDDE
jgi:transposase